MQRRTEHSEYTKRKAKLNEHLREQNATHFRQPTNKKNTVCTTWKTTTTPTRTDGNYDSHFTEKYVEQAAKSHEFVCQHHE